MHGSKLLLWLVAALALCMGTVADAQPRRHAGQPKTARIIPLADEDRVMIEDIAYANLGEILLGRLALDKSMNFSVRSFAQRMIDDHSRAQSQLEKLARSRGMSLPAETDMAHKTIAIGLRGLAGGAFDEEYLKRAGINEHERFIDLLQQMEDDAQDKVLRAYAGRTLRLVGLHLSMANELDGDDGNDSNDSKSGGESPAHRRSRSNGGAHSRRQRQRFSFHPGQRRMQHGPGIAKHASEGNLDIQPAEHALALRRKQSIDQLRKAGAGGQVRRPGGAARCHAHDIAAGGQHAAGAIDIFHRLAI